LLITGLEKRNCRVVIDGFRIHAFDDANLINDPGSEWQKFAKPRSILANLMKISE
jgi:hypothetical protein